MQEGYILEGLRKPLVSIGSRMQDKGGMENVSEGFWRVINAAWVDMNICLGWIFYITFV